MRGKVFVSVVLAILVLSSPTLAQLPSGDPVVLKDFEDQSLEIDGWTKTEDFAGGGGYSITESSIQGDYSGRISNTGGDAVVTYTRDAGIFSPNRIAMKANHSSLGDDNAHRWDLRSGNNRLTRITWDENDDDIDILHDGTQSSINANVDDDSIAHFEVFNISYSNESFYLAYNNTDHPNERVIEGPYGFYDTGITGIDTMEFTMNAGTRWIVDDIQVNGELYEEQTPQKSLEIDVNKFISNGETIPYEVTFNGTDGSLSDVTGQTNVTSQNTSLITVDESSNTLTGDSDNVGSTNVTFEYQGVEENVSIFVGPQTIANIGSMPSPQWIPSILGVGEEDTWVGGVGSEFQWLIVLIIIVYGLTFVTNSATVGVGVGVGGIIALWVAGYVSVGMLLSVLLFGAFITLTTLDLQNDQTVVHEYR